MVLVTMGTMTRQKGNLDSITINLERGYPIVLRDKQLYIHIKKLYYFLTFF